MRSVLLSSLLLCAVVPGMHAQTIVTFKPGPAQAQDAQMWKLNGGCILPGNSQTAADLNFGSSEIINYSDWTWYAAGCDSGTTRSLIRFDQLATIPVTATVQSAQLKLYGIPSTSATWGNNYFPGTPLPNTNEGELYQVNYNQPQWDQNTVTWNTQPGVIGQAVTIPVSTSQWSWDVILNVTSMVQDMISHPTHNHGFLLKLQQEIYYRGVNFASGDNTDSTLRPALVVTYKANNAGIPTAGNAGNGVYNISGNTYDAAGKMWHLDVHAENTQNTHLALYDISGKKIMDREQQLVKGNNELQLSAGDLAGGVYILEISTTGFSLREKLLCN